MINFLFDLGVFIGVLFLSAIAELLIMIIVSINTDDSASYTVGYIAHHIIVIAILLFLLAIR